MTVTDHTALTTSYTWSKSGKDTVVTYSLNNFIESYWSNFFSDAFLSTFTSPKVVESIVRQAFQQWEDAGDIQFVQVDGDDAMINIGLFEFTSSFQTFFAAGLAYYPNANNSTDSITGDIFIDDDWADVLGLWLHEIGHALGLDHPHEGIILDPSVDNTTNTIMSYNGPLTDSLGYLDVAAVQAMYGAQNHTGQIVSTYELLRFETGDTMRGLRDSGGNDLGEAGAWKRLGLSDVQGDGDDEFIFINPNLGRFAILGPDSSGMVDFENYGTGGDTRVADAYVDPLIALGIVTAGSDFDSQQRFANDLAIENLVLLATSDYDRDGGQNVFFKTVDGTAYLNAKMDANGNLDYANYMNEEQLIEFMTANGFGTDVYDDWLLV